ncbi:MAG: hypothetical protein IJN85_00650 [Oscillospiraceae bacterium]|nr:hypothetical protein [Oscillospiraceae bacterium]
MKTLIELFDESPILNVLTSITFKPEKLIFFGAEPHEVEESRNDYINFFKNRKENIEIEFAGKHMSDMLSAENALKKIITDNPDCVVDVSGGKDIALLVTGIAASKLGVPLIAYDKNSGKYINISNCEQADNVDTFGLLDCHDFFAASGGKVIDYEDFSRYNDNYKSFWRMVINVWNIYLKYMDSWASHVQYLQKVTPSTAEGITLKVKGAPSIRVNGKDIKRNDNILNELNDCGAITNLRYKESGDCLFEYYDVNFRRYLTDVGAFLELYIHACALKTEKFSSVVSRVKYTWDYFPKNHKQTTAFRPASNEIDVIAIRGIEPLYISCKTSSPDMKYIDEIYPQAMRMSGGEGHAVFACTHKIDTDMPLYNKAKALGVYIIDGEDIKNNIVAERLSQMAENRYIWKDEPEYMELIKAKSSL